MKKTALWTVLIVVVIVLAMGIFVVVAYHSDGNTKNSATASSTIISYLCDNRKIIAAEFGTSSVTMALSDGRSFVLSEVASAATSTAAPSSSTRYEETSGANQGVIFINSNGAASLMENGSTTYGNCIVNTTPTQASSTATNG
jgi:membrane-bound inhibitor of C-type lysozyme